MFRIPRNFLLISSLLFVCSVNGQVAVDKLKGTPFENARIRWKSDCPSDIRLGEADQIAAADYFNEYVKAFGLSVHTGFSLINETFDKKGYKHSRYKQTYKGIEIAETQYILHSKNGFVTHANGNSTDIPEIDVDPLLSVEQAAFYVSKHFAGYKYQGIIENKDPDKKSTYLPMSNAREPELMISCGNSERRPVSFRLVYRFDVIIQSPPGRYDVDIDAHTGEMVGRFARMYTGNISTRGVSLYNDTVDLVVMDSNYQEEWQTSSWHLDDWNAWGNTGLSWWMADTSLGNNGGYGDGWFSILQIEPVYIQGISPKLTFYHRYSTELPQEYNEFDAWDGVNIQLSADNGKSWAVLENPIPAYDKNSLYSFDYHGYGSGVPGWCGLHNDWTKVTVPLGDFTLTTIIVRFVFASDGGLSTSEAYPDLFGWQIDDIQISNNTQVLYYNEGNAENTSSQNLASAFVTDIEGRYRLRETSRGKGIATFNGSAAGDDLMEATDFVEEDSIFSEEINEVGVSVHWALEKSYDYYLEKHARQGFDNQNGRIHAYTGIVFDSDPNNAAYTGGGFMLFGAGDGFLYGPIASVDVVAHELTHGVTEKTAGLVYEYEPGALNESFSDIFGKSIEYYAENIFDDWLLGDDIAIGGSPFRSMSDPKAYGNPDTYQGENWIPTDGSVDIDYGGVHINNGVQNYWFYLLCEGGSGTNDDDFNYSIDPIGREAAEEIAYSNLVNYLTPTSEYFDAAYYSIQATTDLFGEISPQLDAVMAAWDAVGIYTTPRIVFPEEIIFQSVIGRNILKQIKISNRSISPLEITDITVEGEGFNLTSSPSLPVTVESSYVIGVSYTCETDDITPGSLTVSSNDPENPLVTIALTGYTIPDALDEFTAGNNAPLLGTAYPNPVGASVTIPFFLPVAAYVQISILNTEGSVIRKLAGDQYSGGEKRIEWNCTDDHNFRVPSGNYIISMVVDDQKFSQLISVF